MQISTGFLKLAALLSTIGLTAAEWRYLSRPDLHIPRLEVTQNTGKTADGLLFVAPFTGSPVEDEEHPPHQPSAYILREDGDLVWSGFASYYSGWLANFQKAEYQGQDVLLAFEGKHNSAHGHGHGLLKVLDKSYNHITSIKAGHAKLIDKHEGQLIHDGKSALFQIYHPVPRDLSSFNGGDPQREWIVDSQFQEVDTRSGEVIFEWKSLDHVPPSHSNITLTSGQAGNGIGSVEAWDYFHINSVDKNHDGDYLISARDVNSVYKISGKTGEIIWTLGGRNVNDDFKHLDKASHFSYQHHARFQGVDEEGREIISLYDNSAHGTETDIGHAVFDAPTSSGKVLLVNTAGGKNKWTVETRQAFYPPDGLISKSQGSTQLLDNGNVLVNWGSEGAVTEFTSDGKAIYHAYFEKGHGAQNYRAFKNDWQSVKPSEDAALVGYAYGHLGKLILASSWNGDTEVASWRYYGATKKGGPLKQLGEVERNGFEARLELNHVKHDYKEVKAEGLDKDGKVIIETSREKVVDNAPLPPDYRQDENIGLNMGRIMISTGINVFSHDYGVF
ncbi:hypothetical protein E3Q18_01398 [Wallemia mellicola]|nr:hypothetical protein E3Q18_01398 [Wallemia mellicola]